MHNPFTTGFADELVKLSSYGCVPIGMDGDSCWADRFKGTPLYEQALELEEQQAEADLQMEQRRAAEAEQRAQTEPSYMAEERTRAQFRIGRKQLELQLARMQRGAAGEQAADGWTDLDYAGKPQSAPAQGGTTPPSPQTTGPGQ